MANGGKLLAVLAVLGGSALLITLLSATGAKENVSLLQAPTLHSASYYSHLASSDTWLAGPSHLKAQQVQLKTKVQAARTQELTDWNSGALAGKASLVTQCARGVNSACDQLISDPGAIHELQHIDNSNPNGFAAHHPRRSSALRRRTPTALPTQRMALKPMWHQHPRPAMRRRGPEPAWLKQYRTAAATKKEWETPAWKDGALSDTLDEQWLKSCGEGNFYACKHIAKDNDALHDLLHPRNKLLRTKAMAEQPLQPVYVAQQQSGGFLSSLMNSLGLGDTFVGGDDKEAERAPPKMVPDVGLDDRGTRAVYNDGTVGELSDQQ